MSVKYTVKRISVEDVDMEGFVTFKNKCKVGGQSGMYARDLSREAAVLCDDLANYLALLDYSALIAERDTKKRYAEVVTDTIGTQISREAAAKKDTVYNTLLDETAQLRACFGRIKNAMEFTKSMHYHFKNIAEADSGIPKAVDYSSASGGDE